MTNFLSSLITFTIAIFFTLLGIVCVMIPWSGEVRFGLIRFILEDSLAISLFGLAFIVVGLAIVTYILLSSRRQYYHIKSGSHAVKVDESAIQQYLSLYWKELFPSQDVPCRLALKKNRIHITVDLPHVPLLEQRPLLEKVKQDLHEIFANNIGYEDEFFLSASFMKEGR